MNLSEILSPKHLDACEDKRALYSADRPPTALDYAAVDDARDLFWLFGALGLDRKLIVLAACDCVRRALPRWERLYPEDMRPRRCVEVTEAWCRGEATIEDVSTARSSAAAAAAASAAASASAYAAYAAADAAACAASAAYAAYAAASAASYAAVHVMVLKEFAVVVRLRIPWPVVWTAAATLGLVDASVSP